MAEELPAQSKDMQTLAMNVENDPCATKHINTLLKITPTNMFGEVYFEDGFSHCEDDRASITVEKVLEKTDMWLCRFAHVYTTTFADDIISRYGVSVYTNLPEPSSFNTAGLSSLANACFVAMYSKDEEASEMVKKSLDEWRSSARDMLDTVERPDPGTKTELSSPTDSGPASSYTYSCAIM